MKFIVDAQLPIRLKHWMIERGHDVIHTMDLPNQQFTSDQEIINKDTFYNDWKYCKQGINSVT